MAETSQQSPTEKGKEKAGEVAGQAQEKAQEVAGQARGRVSDQLDQRSTQAGEQVHSTAKDVRSVAEELRKQGKDKPAEVAEKAAHHAERLGGYLKDSNGDKMLSDAEDFGRQKPLAVALGGLALGFAASRVLKASSSQRYQQSQGGTRPLPSPTPRPYGNGGNPTIGEASMTAAPPLPTGTL